MDPGSGTVLSANCPSKAWDAADGCKASENAETLQLMSDEPG
jgi:hypothetical protein